MKIKKITKIKHSNPIKTYCFFEPINHEVLIVGKSGKKYASKQCVNFGFLFGLAAITFKSTLEKEWTSTEILDYIEDNSLEIKRDQFNNDDIYLTVANDIRNKFFETYPFLMPWIKKQHANAKKYGYIDSFHGVRRHIPFLMYEGADIDFKLRANFMNIAVNSPVQSFEAIEIYQALIKIYTIFLERNLKSKFVAMVHDSLVLYVHVTELKEVALILKSCMENNKYSIPIEMECEYGNIWGFGTEVDYQNLDVSIENIKKEYVYA